MNETTMDALDFADAMVELGRLWGLPGGLTDTQMARALRLNGSTPSESVRAYRRGHTPISGPISLVVEAYLDGFRPPEGLAYILNGDGAS